MITHRRLALAASLAFILPIAAFAGHKKDHSSRSALSPEVQMTHSEIRKTFGLLPEFMKNFSSQGLPGAWQELKSFGLNPNTELPQGTKQLIGLAVSARIPCENCVFFHNEFAKVNGVSSAEIQEAIAVSALTQHWSTFMNGLAQDETLFRQETDQVMAHLKRKMEESSAREAAGEVSSQEQSASAAITTPELAYQDIQQTFGSVPEFLRQFPKSAIVGAWNEMKGIETNPKGAISGKDRELIGLAVAAQIPCKYCVYFHTQAAKLNGATENEIREALVQSSITRHWSVVMSAPGVSSSRLRSDVSQAARFVKARLSTQKQMGGKVPAKE